MTTGPNTLLDHHRQDLHDSGLTDETIDLMGVYTEDNHHKILAILGRRSIPKRVGTALVIPFRDADGQLNGYKRLKFDNPRKDRNGKAIKYESPVGERNRLYVPVGTFQYLGDAKTELIITEGEKKAAKADQDGFPCVGLVGVFGWKDGKSERLLPDLETIEWNGRKVYIVFDSDLNDKPEIQDAESRLAAQLKYRGARVLVGRLPDGPDGAKQGVDDFLIAHDLTAFQEVLDKAEEPAAVDSGTVKIVASLIDAMPEARRFLKQSASTDDECILRYHRGEFWAHDGKKYRSYTEDEMSAKVIKYLDPVCSHINNAVVSNLLACIRAETLLGSHVEPPCWLGRKPGGRNFIAMQNGILDVDAFLCDKADVLLPHSPKWFSTICLPYAFDREADCPTWLAVLERNLEDDHERIDVLQEWFGYCVTIDTSLQKFLLMEGGGANGKSVACAVLTAYLGRENVSHTPLEAFGQRFSLIRTLGKLANIASEVGGLDRVAEGNLKAFTSGDRMQFERKFKEPVEALPTARLLLATNNRPRFSDRSGGLWRRMILMPFNATIPESERVFGMDKPQWWEDLGELPGVLIWSLAGLKRLREQRKFTESAVCNAALDDYRLESNPARTFLGEQYTTDVNADVVTADVYSAYREWCETNGYRPLGNSAFGREIVRNFPDAEKAKVWGTNGKRTEGYRGIAIHSDNPDAFT